MPKLLVLCDLDRTLFDTATFFEEIWSFAARLYDIDGDAEQKRAAGFHDYHGDMYDYRFFDHLADAVGNSFDRDDFIQLATHELSGRFLYGDVTEDVVRSIDAIITFGNHDYQTFKLGLCPALSGLQRHIVLQPKGEYIRTTFSQPSVLIDDKPLKDEILPPARFIRIDRSGGESIANELVIQDFSQLPAMLKQLEFN